MILRLTNNDENECCRVVGRIGNPPYRLSSRVI